MMAKAAYDRLSEADRQGFVESARYGAELSRKDIDDHEDAVLAALLGGGMAINADVDKAAFRAALAPAYATWRERFGDLIDRVQAYQ
jgi:TRAP-type C4-dicarboxylate transport system substrate-binding protein